MRERESGVIYHLSYIIMGVGGGKGELGNTKVSIVYSIRIGGGGGGGRTMLGGEVHSLCSLSPSVSHLIKIAVDNLNLRIDCPPLNNE